MYVWKCMYYLKYVYKMCVSLCVSACAYMCSGRAVQASSSYSPRVPPPLLSSWTLPAHDWRVRGGIKDCACLVFVPCAEKCWSTPPYPSSLHAEKCWSTPPYPSSLHAEKCVVLPLPIRDLCCEVKDACLV